ncbi:MAG: 4-(cytidine 5'-diphospho)-2-C-methyl-D-erythritol kinase [Oceanicaulis sp.]
MSGAVVEFAPAKVNLTLRVGPPRADGYHPLASVVAFADWGDAVSAAPAEALTLSLTGPGGESLRAEPQNLVLKAAYALRAAAERPELGAALTLEKHLPVAAGLGGGSSDAAAALRALNTLWDLGFSTKALAEIGGVVGADVPACVHSKPLLMSGIGETIQPLIAWPALYAVLANPGVATPTGAIFKAYDEHGPAGLDPVRTPAAGGFGDALSYLSASANDLQTTALLREPAVRETLNALERLKDVRLVRMTGSGATCFGLFETEAAAKAGADFLAEAKPDWTVRAVLLGGAA